MLPDDFQYELIDPITGKTYAIDEEDMLITTDTPEPLPYTPDGWQEVTVKFMRNATYQGLFRDFTIPLRFIRQGATIIRSLFYTKGMEAVINLRIKKLNRSTYQYESWYEGEIDLSQVKDSIDFLDVNVAEGGIPKILKANENTVYEIPMISGENLITEETIVIDEFIDNTGAISSGEGWVMAVIRVEPGTTYTFGRINLSVGGYSAFYQIDGATMELFNGDYIAGETVTVTAPNNAAYLMLDLKRPADNNSVYVEAAVNVGTALMLPDAELLQLDGMKLRQSTTSVVNGFTDNIWKRDNHLPASFILSSEGDQVGTLMRDTAYHLIGGDANNNGAIGATNDPIFKAGSTASISIEYDLKIKTAYDAMSGPPLADPNLIMKVDIRIFNGGTLKSAINIYQSGNDLGVRIGPPERVVKKLHEIKGAETINVDENDEVYLFVYGSVVSTGTSLGGSEWIIYYYTDPDDITFQQGTINIGFGIQHKKTNVYAYRIDRLFEKLVKKVFGPQYNAVSQILAPDTSTPQARTLMITCGDAIRGLSGAVIKTSFKDFFQSAHVQKNVAMGVNGNTLSIEARNAFFTGAEIIDLGEVKDVKVSVATDYIYNTLKIGYPNQTYDDLNGRTEYNTTFLWNLPISRVVKELNLVSPYRGDTFGIEFIRINLDGKNTTDNKGDNDVFIVDSIREIDPSGNPYWTAFRQIFVEVQGVFEGNYVYNISISPKRLLYVHGDSLRSFLYGQESKEIVFQSTDKNPYLLTIALSGEVVSERADVPVGILNGPFFKPFYMEFTTQVPMTFTQMISISKTGMFRFTYRGQSFKGCLMEGGIKPATMEQQTFRLLAAVDNDLTKLIA